MTKLQLAKNLIIDSEKLFSVHVGIAGSTGAGKSRNVAARLLAECLQKQPKAPNGIPYAFLVIDTNDEYVGFLDKYHDRVVVFSPDVSRGVPFRISSKNIAIDELSTFLKEVTKKELSQNQATTLWLAIDELRSKGDYTLEQLFTRLYELEAYNILPAFEKIMAANIFGPDETPLRLLVRPGQASVLAIGGYSEEVQAIIVAHLLRALFIARKNDEVGPIVAILEECSVFAPEGELRPSSDIIKTISMQGRGYHFILVSIFQRSSLTSKNLLSQCLNLIIGKTGNPTDRQAILRSAEKIEREHDNVIKNLQAAKEFLVTGFIVDEPVVVKIPDQKLLVAKGGRVKPTVIEATFKREDMTDYIARIRHLEESERKRMGETLARLRTEREERMRAPVVPKETQQKLKQLEKEKEAEKLRYEKGAEAAKEREKTAFRRAREQYEGKIRELEADVERLTRQVAMTGGDSEKPIWEQEIVKRRLSNLSDKQRDLVIFLERVGPSSSEKIAPILGVSRQTVTAYVSDINKEIEGLVMFDRRQETYRSRLADLFPTQAGALTSEEIQRLRNQVLELRSQLDSVNEKLKLLADENNELTQKLKTKPRDESSEAAALLEEVDRKLVDLQNVIPVAGE
jgi:hypothetical protein